MALDKKKFKLLILIYNIFLMVFGFITIFYNSYLLYNIVRFKHLINSDGITAVVLVIVTGLVSCAVAVLGCNIVQKGRKVSIILYGLFLLVLMACNIGLCIWILSIIHNLKEIMTPTIETTFSSATQDKIEASVSMWEKLQSELMCCGVGGPTDYRVSNSVPWSCFKRSLGEENNITSDFHTIHQQGCLLILYDFIRKYLLQSTLSSLAISLYQLLGAVEYFYFSKIQTIPVPEERRQNSSSRISTQGSVGKRLLSSSAPPPNY